MQNNGTIEQKDIDRILGNGIIIPPQPGVLVQIEQLAQKEDVDLAEITRLIGSDVALSAAVFRLAGSPIFKLRKKPASVEQAVPILGLKQTISIVRSESLRKAVCDPRYLNVFSRLWERFDEIGLLTAIITDSLKLREFTAEQAFTAGMFCDCGVPILMSKLPDYCAEMKQNAQAPWPDLAEEDSRLDTDHAVVGALLAHFWKLPDIIVDTIRNHHDPSYASPVARRIIAALQLALRVHDLAHQRSDGEWEKNRALVLSELDVGLDEETELVEEITEQFHYAT